MYFSSLLNLPPTHSPKPFHLITPTILTEQCQLQESSLYISIFMLFLSLRFRYSPQHLILRHHQSTFFHYGQRTIFTPSQNNSYQMPFASSQMEKKRVFWWGVTYIYYDEEAFFSLRRSILLRSGKEGRKERKRQKGVRYGFIWSCRSYGSSCIHLNYL